MTVPAVPDLDTIRQRAEAATEGPWDASGWIYGTAKTESYGVWSGPPNPAHPKDPVARTSRYDQGYHDAEFIAHARTDVPALIAAVESLSSRLVVVEAERDTLAAKIEAVNAVRDKSREEGSGFVNSDDLRRALSDVPGEREREG